MHYTKLITLLIFSTILFSCDSGPKVVEAESSSSSSAAGQQPTSAVDKAASMHAASGEHKVQVEEVLHTDKYTYMNVTENGETFWIAAPKTEIESGETVYYKGGLMKKNFFSREYNRVFETLYLVSGVRTNAGGSAVDEALSQMQGAGNALSKDVPVNVKPAAGAVSLAELVNNKDKYGGKTVKVTGKCIKVNPNIMGRNWIHVQDGTLEGQDLTITTAENIPVGHVVTMEGVITLNKDFGAGYKYDIIMEDAVINN